MELSKRLVFMKVDNDAELLPPKLNAHTETLSFLTIHELRIFKKAVLSNVMKL